MRKAKDGAQSRKQAPEEKFALIADTTLLALHRRLLAGIARHGRSQEHLRKPIEKYAAAKVAVAFDLKKEDGVFELDSSRFTDALVAGLIHKTRKKARIALVWGGEAGAEWQEALEAARAHSLPLVFVCDAKNDVWARRLMPRAKGKLKPGEELPCVAVDGHDVVAAYRVAHEAINRARRDRGPTLILLGTYEVEGRAFTDAVADVENYLRGRGLLKTGSKGHRDQKGSGRGSKEARVKQED